MSKQKGQTRKIYTWCNYIRNHKNTKGKKKLSANLFLTFPTTLSSYKKTTPCKVPREICRDGEDGIHLTFFSEGVLWKVIKQPLLHLSPVYSSRREKKRGNKAGRRNSPDDGLFWTKILRNMCQLVHPNLIRFPLLIFRTKPKIAYFRNMTL